MECQGYNYSLFSNKLIANKIHQTEDLSVRILHDKKSERFLRLHTNYVTV